MILTFIVINVQVIGGGEDGDERGEACRLALSVHAVAGERKNESELREEKMSVKLRSRRKTV